MAKRPPLSLFVEVESPSGARFKWDANQPIPGDRPKGLLFRSKLGEGFSDGGCQLPRRIDRDYLDLELVNNVVVTGADGTIAYEGRISAMPRELSDTHSIGVTLTGWMAHAKDQKMSHVYVDRDLGSWGSMSSKRKAWLLTNNFTPYEAESSSDPTDSEAQVSTVWTGGWGTFLPSGEAWYDAGAGNLVSKVGYSWARTNTTSMNLPADTNWLWAVSVASDDNATAYSTTGDISAAGPSVLQTFTATTPYRYATLVTQYGAGGVSADGTRWGVDWTKLAVYGDHDLTIRTGEVGEPGGVTASDVIRHAARRWCPKLDTSGIQDTTYVIQHLAFKDPVDPYDVFLQVNKYHLWDLGVWEHKRLDFKPLDLTDWDWEVRTDDPGVTFSPQGPSIDDLHNGICVRYTDIATGIQHVLTPASNTELLDTSESNPWNRWGIKHYDEIALSSPTLAAQALSIGRAALAERNRPKAPGTITIRGHIRDRQGNWQPYWKVRAGDAVAITTSPNDAPRLVHEATCDTESQTVTMAIDAPPATLEAYLDRVATALQARGLS